MGVNSTRDDMRDSDTERSNSDLFGNRETEREKIRELMISTHTHTHSFLKEAWTGERIKR